MPHNTEFVKLLTAVVVLATAFIGLLGVLAARL